MKLRWILIAAVVLTGSASCGRPPPPLTAARVDSVFDAQLQRARRALADEQWLAARTQLQELRDALPATHPIGAEARRLLAQVAFELGNYREAIETARALGDGDADGTEILGLAHLFSCEFSDAEGAFYRLAQLDEARGRVWLGVVYAWSGADANAERELGLVIEQHPGSEHAANARFYLAQLAFWGSKGDEGRRVIAELDRASPGYRANLARRAANWVTRRTHLMRAYFTLDTLARAAAVDTEPTTAFDQGADQALEALRVAPGACETHIARLSEARVAFVEARRARAAQLAAMEAAARAEQERLTRDTDGDRLADVRDRCPDQPETYNAIEDDDGCPEATAAIEVVGNQIRIRAGFAVYFAPGREDLLPESEPVIAGLARVLTSPQYAWIRRIRLDGHTDDVGEPDENLELSEKRVRSVARELAARGVERGRIELAFYGESRPIDWRTTEDARARNRRVEFIIIDPATFGSARR